jgi:hypothetical protein
MKLNRLLKSYYREQVDAMPGSGGRMAPARRGRTGGSHAFDLVFQGTVIVIVTLAMLSGRFQPSFLVSRIGVVIDRYALEDRMIDSIESLMIAIKTTWNAGGGL